MGVLDKALLTRKRYPLVFHSRAVDLRCRHCTAPSTYDNFKLLHATKILATLPCKELELLENFLSDHLLKLTIGTTSTDISMENFIVMNVCTVESVEHF